MSICHLMEMMNSYNIEKNIKYVISRTYRRRSMKYFLFQNPTQLLIHGQWWSMFKTHLLQAEQWWHLSGLNTLHIRQYLRRLFSGSPRWKPYIVKKRMISYPKNRNLTWISSHRLDKRPHKHEKENMKES